jgi:hypothetical protein
MRIIARLEKRPSLHGINAARVERDRIHHVHFIALFKKMPGKVATDEAGRR